MHKRFTLAITSLLLLATTGTQAIPQISAGPGQPVNGFNPNTKALSRIASSSPIYYYNWSGYAATGGQFNDVVSTYVQPSVTCPVPGAWTLFWVGFDGFQNSTVEQAGTAAFCSYDSHPEPTYYTWWEMYPTNNIQVAPLAVKPGDKIMAEVSYNDNNASYTMQVNNKTTKQQFSQVATCASNLTCSRASADWIVERPTLNGAYTPLASWNTMSLTSDKASNTIRNNGKASLKPINTFNNTPIYMVDDPYTGKNLATVGTVNKNGKVFSDSWLAAQ